MTPAGRLVAVVGPSGVGKDSVMAGLHARLPDLRPVRRTITRAPDLGGEDYTPATVAEFDRLRAQGAFCLHWGAHGLFYGIPMETLQAVRDGHDCLANLSRGALVQASQVFPALTVLHITASPQTLAKRLAGRGRETEAEIAARLAQAAKPLPELPTPVRVIEVANDGALEDAIGSAAQALYPVRA
ncbi:phosphonate metabolism protein/1,5-bisphosphokinase (PRPP-forming) PhnN [Sagittula sp. SSi028]|uniref:phosphonate metabolism protein/1,5-bisphosphokinase (PRPP-forming) PhnN n=1 Tax=Sagittula sp. SSi028 TaxID=3400636 RepID=UPI003AF9A687